MANDGLTLDMDWDISKAEAKQRKLNREMEDSQRKANIIKKNINDLNEELSTEERLQKDIKDRISEQSKEAGKLEQQITKVKDGTASLDERMALGGLETAEQKLAEMEKGIQQNYTELEKCNSKHEKISNQIAKQNLALKKQNATTANIGDQILLNSKKQNKFAEAFEKSQKSADRFGRRIKELIKSALIFSVITKALNAMKEALSGYLKQDSKLSKSIAQLKGNLAVIGATISNALAPYIQWFVDKLVQITSLLGQTLAKILGKDISKMKKLAEATAETAEAAEEAKGALASFDEINTFTEQTSGAQLDNSLGIDTTAISNAQKLDDELNSVLSTVAKIGLGILGWKVANSFLSDLSSAKGLLKGLKGFAGTMLITMGLELMLDNIEAIKKGEYDNVSWESALKQIFSGLGFGAGIALFTGQWWAIPIAMILEFAITDIVVNWDEIKRMAKSQWNMLTSIFTGDAEKFSTNFIDYWIAWFETDSWQTKIGKVLCNLFGISDEKMQDMYEAVKSPTIRKKIEKIISELFNTVRTQILNLDLWDAGKTLINFFKTGTVTSSSKYSRTRSVPQLATGAVLPGGSPMLAWVNDQPKGQTYVEGSVDNIAAALEKVMAGKSYGNSQQTIIAPLYIDGREVARATRSGNDKLGNQTVFGGFANVY